MRHKHMPIFTTTDIHLDCILVEFRLADAHDSDLNQRVLQHGWQDDIACRSQHPAAGQILARQMQSMQLSLAGQLMYPESLTGQAERVLAREIFRDERGEVHLLASRWN